MKKLFSRQSILPDRTNHYDEHGHKVGYSRPSLLGTYTNHYDEHGHKVGYSREGLFGTVHYDENGHKVGVSHDSILGYKNHYDTHGKKVGYKKKVLICYGGMRVVGTSLQIQTRISCWETFWNYETEEQAIEALQKINAAIDQGLSMIEM